MNYKQLIEKLKTIRTEQEQVNYLFEFLLSNGEYDYLYLEIERLKKLDVNAFADLYDEDLQEQAFKILEKKTSISKELKYYFATKQYIYFFTCLYSMLIKALINTSKNASIFSFAVNFKKFLLFEF